MLSTQIDNNVIELIMMKVYLDSESLSTPSSATTGFLRSVKMLAEWDFKAEPLYVANMNGQASSGGSKHRFDPAKRVIAQKVFEERRRKEKDINGDHAGAWIIVIEDDLLGLRWSEKVSRVIASRVKVLAKATILAVERSVTVETGRIDVQALFTTPTADYDVLIKLNPELITRYAQAVQSAAGLWEEKTKFRTVSSGGVAYGDEVRIGFDPTGSLVKDIQVSPSKQFGVSSCQFADSSLPVAIVRRHCLSIPRR
jgi:U3 small nucleolar RNA-associated protein 22